MKLLTKFNIILLVLFGTGGADYFAGHLSLSYQQGPT
jgi:hypothetical protein